MALVKDFFIFCAVFMLWSSQAAYAEETRVMTYDVYAGGIHALDASLTIKSTSKTYNVALSSATHGLLGSLAPWSGRFETEGITTAKFETLPKLHQSASTWKGQTETKTFTYDGKGTFQSYKVTEGTRDKTPDKTDPELTKGATDILSAIYGMMGRMTPAAACVDTSLIFDGDRNFDLAFKNAKPEELPKSDFNMYQGAAISCEIEVTPQKGKWKKKPRGWLSIQEQGRQKGSLPTIWFGQPDVKEGIPADKVPYIPVKIRVKTNYGILFMHLTSYKVTGLKASGSSTK